MKKIARIATVTALGSGLMLAGGGTAQADHCGGTTIVDLGAAYVDVRHVGDETSLYSIWIYAETNGQTGLQRGGDSVLGADLGGRDNCVDPSDNGPDLIIF
ncbi:MAG TPA: hypothetical protein VNB24_01565 [Acidimicrobiales bacterium]|nr:hypothetical protein [Acidimicrobiales bacterium]